MYKKGLTYLQQVFQKHLSFSLVCHQSKLGSDFTKRNTRQIMSINDYKWDKLKRRMKSNK